MNIVEISANGGGDGNAAQQNPGHYELLRGSHVVCSPWEGLYLEQAHAAATAGR
ncbi:hypothetical protein ACIPYU_20270 [Paenarthrobacter nicotinovorans]|uniref:hypothetical protein n=1 Tax=Paenarthrobacter nicotinovorans TaxID=29320 RepID=UPI003800BE19